MILKLGGVILAAVKHAQDRHGFSLGGHAECDGGGVPVMGDAQGRQQVVTAFTAQWKHTEAVAVADDVVDKTCCSIGGFGFADVVFKGVQLG